MKWTRDPPDGLSRLFLAGLLDALLAGVEGSLLALGRIDHVLLSLGICRRSVWSPLEINFDN